MPFGRRRIIEQVADECMGAPTPTIGTITHVHNACPTGIVWTIPWSGMTFGAFELEIWRKAWDSTGSEPGSTTFWSRRVSGTSRTDSETSAGSDGGGAARTYHRRYELRVVPAGSANGAGPFCSIGTLTADDSQASNLCTF